MNHQVDMPSIPIDFFKNYYVPLFDFTSIPDATESCEYSELLGEPLRLELKFSLRRRHVTELNVLVDRMASVPVDKFDVVGKRI